GVLFLGRVGYFHPARDAGLGTTPARGVVPELTGPTAEGARRGALGSVTMDAMCRANSNGTVAVGTSASGSSLIGALDGVTLNSWYPVIAPRVRATTRSVRPNALNHQAARRPAPRASLRATSGAAMPAAMSPSPAGSANSAGR